MTVNIELLTKTMEYIEAHPEEHNQSTFRSELPCGTVMCFAGHAITLDGGEWGIHPIYESFMVRGRPGEDQQDKWFFTHPSGRARKILGLDHETANQLFFGCDDLEEVRACVKDILDIARYKQYLVSLDCGPVMTVYKVQHAVHGSGQEQWR